MEFLEGFREAIRLVVTLDPYVRDITMRTILVSGTATLLAMLVGVPAGYALARTRFRGRTVPHWGLVNTGMGMPPVVVGLVVFLLLVRNGPFGDYELIYTREAMVIAQFIIALPLVVGFTAASIQSLPPQLADLLAVLGAGRLRSLLVLAREARLGLLAAVMAGFGAVVSEVGASMQVGGNIDGDTRVLTTAMVLETSRGANERAIALGIILLAMALAVNLVLTLAQQRGR
ncbi:MAG: ABC transporter permease [Dehalococcoidia bacterium]|nr:ABC transporter permease [Dehalococcoidia bacterium]